MQAITSMSSEAAESPPAVHPRRAFCVYRPQDIDAGKEFWAKNQSDGAVNAKLLLETLERKPLPWLRSAAPEDDDLTSLGNRFPNFAQVVECIRRAAALARVTPGGPLILPPLLFVGPPGIGKSRFTRDLAKVLAVPLIQFSLATASASFGLAGLNAQFAGGGPGYLVRAIARLGVPDPLIVLDEIDKASQDQRYDPLTPLYELLERQTAKQFVDDGLQVPLDLSAVTWIATCNDADCIDAPLLSRFMVVDVPPPSSDAMRSIASDVYADLLAAHGLQAYFDEQLPEDVLTRIETDRPRELDRLLLGALGAAALAGRRELHAEDLPVPRRSHKPIGFHS